MIRKSKRGVSSLEFALLMLVLIPLLLGTGAFGINMIRTLETIQLARDAGHMYARGLDFALPGNKTILANIGTNLGLNVTADAGNAVVILSALTYVDKAACAAGGAVDGSGNPLGCTNFGKWVFTQRLVIGKSTLRTSNLGSPLTSGPSGVTVNATTGQISASDYVTKSGAVATFSGIKPYAILANGSAEGLPSLQKLYISEAAATTFKMPPFVSVPATYSYGLF